MEQKWETVSPYIDCVITFEELQALFDARDIDIASLPDEHLNNASYYGRIFARSGALPARSSKRFGSRACMTWAISAISPFPATGIREWPHRPAQGVQGRFAGKLHRGYGVRIGCIGGAACLTHGPKNKLDVDKYGQLAKEKTMTDAISVYDFE